MPISNRQLKIAIFLLLISTCAVAQNQYYVSTAGSDSTGTGTQGSPWATIAHADSALTLGTSGAVVHVAPGTYSTGSFTTSHSGTASARIQFISDTKFGAKLTSAGWIADGDYVDINGFDITDPDSSGGWDAIIVSGNFVHVINNYIHNIGDNQTTACPQDGALVVSAANHDALIDSNIVYSTGHRDGNCGGTGGTSNHGIYIAGYHNTITNNLVSKAAGYGLEFYHNSCQNVIANNTVFYNFTGGIQVANGTADGLSPCLSTGDAYVSVNNNLVIHNGWGCATSTHHNGGIFFGMSGIGTGNKAFNNYMAGNLSQTSCGATNAIDVYSGQPSPTQGGNINGGTSGYASLFANYHDEYSGNPNDYQLSAASAALGTGVASSSTVCAASPGISPCVPTVDINGVARPGSDGAYSIGAYESAISPSPVAQGGDWNNVTASPPPPVWPPTDSNGQTLASTLFRVWDSGMKWSQIETANGVYTWTKLDEVVNGLVPNPLMKVVYTFGSTPKWASACSSSADPSTCLPGPTGSGFGGGTQCAQPSDYSCTPTSDVATDGTGTDAFFQNFVLSMVNRYPNKISYFEGWNEADSPNFWCQATSPTACGGGNSSTTANTPALKRLIRMMWDAKQIINCKSPSSKLISPAGHVGSMPTWFHQFANSSINAPAGNIGGCTWSAATVSGKQIFDITNEHMRGTSSTNSDPTAVIAAYNAAVTEINLDNLPTALMNTEFGYNGTAQAANPDIQAAFVGINYILQNSYSGTSIPILAGIWYQIDSPQGPLQGTIAGLAFNTVAGWFAGGTESGCTKSGTIYTCPGTNALNQATLYAWDMGQNCNSGCTTANHSFGSQYTSYNTLDGASHFTTGGNGTAPLGYKPIRLIASSAVKTLAVNGGNNQSGTVSTVLPVALTVLATSNGVAQSGVSVTFSDSGAGGVFTPSTATTNGSGIASTTYTLPSSAQTITVTATATGYSPITFTETATAAAQVLTISASTGNNQTGNLSTLLPIPLSIVATVNGTPTSGVTVTYSDGGAGGSFGTTSPTTDNTGQASSTYTLPNSAQTVTVTVSSSGYTSATFTETAAALVVSPQSGNNQTGTVGTDLPVSLQALVTSNGTVVPGVTVTFNDGGAGGSFSVSSGVSNAFGIVSTVYTLPSTPKTITITASATGYTSGTFTENSVVDILSPIAGNAQGGPNGTTLPVPLTVLATINGVPASGIAILFTDNGAGGSFGTPAGITGSNGTITTTYTLPNSAQSITINASSAGYTSATFTETSFTPNPPAGVAVTPGVKTNNSHIN